MRAGFLNAGNRSSASRTENRAVKIPGTYLNSISPGSILSALASFRMVTNRGLRSPLSSRQIALTVTPDARDKSAWLITFLILSSFNVATTVFQHKCGWLSILE